MPVSGSPYQGAKLDAGRDLALVSGGAVSFEAVKDLRQESHEKSKGRTDDTLRQSQLVAQGSLAIKAAQGLKIDVKHIDQKTVYETIDVMVKADPSLAWLKVSDCDASGEAVWLCMPRAPGTRWQVGRSVLGDIKLMIGCSGKRLYVLAPGLTVSPLQAMPFSWSRLYGRSLVTGA